MLAGSLLVLAAGLAQPAAARAKPGPVDYDAVNRQAERLRGLEAADPAAAGGYYWDEKAGQMVVRYVATGGADRLRAGAAATTGRPGELPIRYERTASPIGELRATAARLDASRGWAGDLAGLVHQVYLDELHLELVVDAAGRADEVTAAATKASGLAVRVVVSPEGMVDQDSRRAEEGLLQGGFAMWSTSGGSGDEDAFCTAGFRMTRGGTNSNWMTTAGHCGPNGRLFYHNGRVVARVSSNYESLGTDVAMLAGVDETFSRYAWFGDRNATRKAPVSAKNTGYPAVGSSVYVSGANGGLTRGVVTGTSGTCAGTSGLVLIDTTGDPNGHLTRPGDSGAPVFVYNPATTDPDDVRAVGTHVCGNNAGVSAFESIHFVEAATGAVVVIGGN